MKQNGNASYADVSVASCAYLAGIIDGEGFISIREHKTKKGAISHSLRVGIASTSIAWLYDLRKRWGSIGSVFVAHRKETIEYKGVRKPKISWELNGKDALFVLSHTFPYLGIKRDRALIALNFKVVGPGGRRTEQERAATAAARIQIKKLNQRGVVALVDLPAEQASVH